MQSQWTFGAAPFALLLFPNLALLGFIALWSVTGESSL
jgi:hypothetical protein